MMNTAARRGMLMVGLLLLPVIAQAEPKLEIPETVTFQPNVEYSQRKSSPLASARHPHRQHGRRRSQN